MGTFVPTTAAEREQMLRTIGVSSVEDLFRDVPQQMYLDGYLDLPPGRSELETLEAVSALAERNRVFRAQAASRTCRTRSWGWARPSSAGGRTPSPAAYNSPWPRRCPFPPATW